MLLTLLIVSILILVAVDFVLSWKHRNDMKYMMGIIEEIYDNIVDLTDILSEAEVNMVKKED